MQKEKRLDNRKPISTMIFSEKQILQKCNYDLVCNINSSGISIKHPWGDKKYFDLSKIKDYDKVSDCLGKIILKKICEDNNYPYKWSFLETEVHNKDLNFLCDDLLESGVKRQHLELAAESHIQEEFSTITDFYFNIDKYIGNVKLR